MTTKAPFVSAASRSAIITMSDSKDTIRQLNQARDIVLKDPALYPQVVPGILPIITAEQPVELRRWGADFLAETFASPVVNESEKQKLSLRVLDTLKGYLNRKEELGEEEDWTVVKSAVQCAASIYPLVFRHTISNAEDSETWTRMASMKSSVLRRMDTSPGSVRICCIMFVARVVQVQTPGLIADPRRPEQNEISLALVPRDHPIIPPTNLEAEASGLLDRVLEVLQDNISDSLIATATLNALSSLVQRRATISTKILSTVLSFNPLTLASATMDGKDKIAVKSMTRTTISFLTNTLKRNPNHALAGRIQQQVERLRYGLIEVFSDQNPLKRPAPDEPTDGLSDDKRRKLDREADAGTTPLQQPGIPPLPPGPISVAQLFTLTNDPRVVGFHVEVLPPQIVSQLVPALLAATDQAKLDTAINVVRTRILKLEIRPPPMVGRPGEDEDDDYNPPDEFGDSEQATIQMDQLPPLQGQPELAIPSFDLPPPPLLSEEERVEYSEMANKRLFGALQRFDDEAKRKGKKQSLEKEKGFNRLASTGGQDRDGWIALLSRLATRPDFGLNEEESKIKQENEERAAVKQGRHGDLPNKIRKAFHEYITGDWRRHIDVAIAWLNEEWYADRLLAKSRAPTAPADDEESQLPNYTHHTLRLLDTLILYLDIKDGRYLIRFLSEIPHLPVAVFQRILKIAIDPERVQLCAQALLYLIMLRPPVRSAAIDCAEEMWRTNDDAKAAAAKILTKWRPNVLEEGKGEGVKQEG